jgi:hypothetical protein
MERRSLGLTGGLKGSERQLDIARPGLEGVDSVGLLQRSSRAINIYEAVSERLASF